MKAGELLRRIKRHARKTGATITYVASHGKGSHGTVYYGDKVATMIDLRREIPEGTRRAILKQLGITDDI